MRTRVKKASHIYEQYTLTEFMCKKKNLYNYCTNHVVVLYYIATAYSAAEKTNHFPRRCESGVPTKWKVYGIDSWGNH